MTDYIHVTVGLRETFATFSNNLVEEFERIIRFTDDDMKKMMCRTGTLALVTRSYLPGLGLGLWSVPVRTDLNLHADFKS